jgi:uncharacterized membrane protein YhaH (DUF805 family)
MGLFHYLFGFSGRINRAKQWAILLVGFTFEILLGIVFSLAVGFTAMTSVSSLPAFLALPQFHTFVLIACALYALTLYISVAVMTKRLHDRDRSAWWLLIFLVLPIIFSIPRYIEMFAIFSHFNDFIKAAQQHPGQPPFVESPLAIIGGGASAIISLWAFVELFCLPGTAGDNRYGPDPLAGRA